LNENNLTAATIKNFTPVPDLILIKYGLVTAMVYGSIWRFVQMKNGVCTASQKKIATRAGVCIRTLQKNVKILISEGYITSQKNSFGITYSITKLNGFETTSQLSLKRKARNVVEVNYNNENGTSKQDALATQDLHTKKVLKKDYKKELKKQEQGLSNNNFKEYVLIENNPLLDVDVFPELVRPLAKSFVERTERRGKLQKTEIKSWIMDLENLRINGITPEIINAAIEYSYKKELIVATPQSIVKVALSLKTKLITPNKYPGATKIW